MQNEFACVRLGDEQVMVELDKLGQPTAKFALRIKDATGGARRLSRDEELVLAAAPSTKAEREAAARRVNESLVKASRVRIQLLRAKWQPGEKQQALAQIERGSADLDDLD